VFTTSPKLVGASLRAALRHPDVRILNCSVDMPYASIRTYYSRVYEAKFITGAIAAAVAREDRVGYVADTPTFGVPANINAFALGARMVNPRVKVSLQWSCLPGDPIQAFQKQGITVVSGRDTPTPFRPAREFGTFRISPGGTLMDLASPFWHWGQFYENVVRTVLDGGWTRDKSGTDGTAVNYWWGMNSGVMDVLLSRELPHDVRHLANILRSGIIAGSIDPFACYITAQNGTVMNEGRTGFTPEQILHMDWLCDAVEGHLPEFDELIDCARPMYRMQGIHRDRLPAEKEADL
jgi:basic membrane protein A